MYQDNNYQSNQYGSYWATDQASAAPSNPASSAGHSQINNQNIAGLPHSGGYATHNYKSLATSFVDNYKSLASSFVGPSSTASTPTPSFSSSSYYQGSSAGGGGQSGHSYGNLGTSTDSLGSTGYSQHPQHPQHPQHLSSVPQHLSAVPHQQPRQLTAVPQQRQLSTIPQQRQLTTLTPQQQPQSTAHQQQPQPLLTAHQHQPQPLLTAHQQQPQPLLTAPTQQPQQQNSSAYGAGSNYYNGGTSSSFFSNNSSLNSSSSYTAKPTQYATGSQNTQYQAGYHRAVKESSNVIDTSIANSNNLSNTNGDSGVSGVATTATGDAQDSNNDTTMDMDTNEGTNAGTDQGTNNTGYSNLDKYGPVRYNSDGYPQQTRPFFRRGGGYGRSWGRGYGRGNGYGGGNGYGRGNGFGRGYGRGYSRGRGFNRGRRGGFGFKKRRNSGDDSSDDDKPSRKRKAEPIDDSKPIPVEFPNIPEELAAKMKNSFCEICSTILSSLDHAKSHYTGRKHEKRLQRSVNFLNLDGTTRENFVLTSVVKEEDEMDADGNPVTNTTDTTTELPTAMAVLSCKLCEKEFSSNIVAVQHYTSKFHAKKMSEVDPQLNMYINPLTGEYQSDPPKAIVEADLVKADTRSGKGRFKTRRIQAVGSNLTYFCDLCCVGMTSREHMDSHMTGKHHVKAVKQIALQQEIVEAKARSAEKSAERAIERAAKEVDREAAREANKRDAVSVEDAELGDEPEEGTILDPVDGVASNDVDMEQEPVKEEESTIPSEIKVATSVETNISQNDHANVHVDPKTITDMAWNPTTLQYVSKLISVQSKDVKK